MYITERMKNLAGVQESSDSLTRQIERAADVFIGELPPLSHSEKWVEIPNNQFLKVARISQSQLDKWEKEGHGKGWLEQGRNKKVSLNIDY